MRSFDKDAALPFEPHIGKRYEKIPNEPRVMYIGKATDEWTEEKGTKIENVPQDTPFFRFIRDLVPEIYGKAGYPAPNAPDYQWMWDRIVWSNLMKIGGRKGKSEVSPCQPAEGSGEGNPSRRALGI